MTIAAGARLGAYEVLAPLGAGGMGEVYRARDVRLGREVALKVLPESLANDRDRLARFEQEARSASALNHPNIVTIHEIGREGETAYIAMELVDGRTLRDLIASGPMPVRRILAIGAQVADGLAKAHGAGIVHRDLKPENVMVSKDGFVKLLDFGLAKLTDTGSGEGSAMPTLAHPETRPGTVMGTVGYMSPEQASGEPLDFRSDQFSLGSMLYEMATGQRAFLRKTAAETMSAIIRDEPEPVARLRPDLPLAVRWILDRCLAKDPEERYASTRDLARDLAGLRDHIAEASSGSEALLATPRRRRSSPYLAGLALLAAGLAAGWALTRGVGGKAPPPPSFKRLTFRQGGLHNARFAPDGQTIFYGAHFFGDPGDSLLYSVRPESPESRLFEFKEADIVAVSDSGELAILLDESPSGIGTLSRVPMSGGVPRQIAEGIPYAGADWAPGGNELAIVRQVEGKSRLEFPIGKVIYQTEGDLGFPRFSPKGDRIAFWEYEPAADHQTVSVIDVPGRSVKRLSSGWSLIAGAPCWRSNSEIWFTATKATSEREALWAVDSSGRERLVTRAPGNLELDDVSRDGRALMGYHTLLHSIRGLPPGATEERELSWLDFSISTGLSDDGKKLLITERGEAGGATQSVYLRGTDGSPAVRLGEGFGFALSPDQKTVLMSTGGGPARIGTGSSTLILLPTGPGESKTLKNGGLASYGWANFLPDGKRIVFSGEAAGRPSRLYVQEIPDGEPRPVSAEGVRFLPPAAVSPDGKWVVASSKGKYALYPIAGGGTRPLPTLKGDDLVAGFTSDGRSIYVLRYGPSPIPILLVDVETGHSRVWKSIPREGMQYMTGLRVSPDGGAYVYSYARAFSELDLVEGLR